MNILTIETTGAEASVAVINDKSEVFMETSDQKMSHLQNLMPMVDILLKKRGLSIDDMDYIAVSEGPGSFTGIRIGVSSARALAQALGIRTIGVPTLKSFLYHVPGYHGIVCPILDARRNQVYGGAYRWTADGQYEEVVPGAAWQLAELLERLETEAGKLNPASADPDGSGSAGPTESGPVEITFFGDGVISYKEQILNWHLDSSSNDNIRVLFAEEDVKFQKASSVARLALELCRAGEIKSLYDLKPVYMRKAEAERKLEGKAD
ncbi:MAG TPA: tRNA (adenosine(37)-N6)-threonylcarbamoyltransferase complex dimerization subunit type 1 TsaB [Anaerovoracaceae bacterium]|nr:tRNA (adenosine(37)-N6)-threonylcarbamoyltransferase complex dimerization subunit type 1 TsaB [Anaerovoracaceae bacterium]